MTTDMEYGWRKHSHGTWLYRPPGQIWNYIAISERGALELWDGEDWAPQETQPGMTIDELKALGLVLLKMDK